MMLSGVLRVCVDNYTSESKQNLDKMLMEQGVESFQAEEYKSARNKFHELIGRKERINVANLYYILSSLSIFDKDN